MVSAFDPRTTPARGDIAAKSLVGLVASQRFVEGLPKQVGWGVAPLRHAPAESALLDTEALFGERFTVYDEKDGWAWGQAEVDSYVGYVPSAALEPAGPAPTHRVIALASHLYPAPEVKAPAKVGLTFGARLRVTGSVERFASVAAPAGAAFVPLKHIAPLGAWTPDFVAVAEQFLGAPYLWGGRTSAGLDCSALVQLALADTGRVFPRDSDQQQVVGNRLGVAAVGQLRRGDLLFWNNHVAIAIDARRLIHANGTSMAVSIEDVDVVMARIAASDGALLDINRL
jgi:cell wall-associated NlpC family hydrolase